MYTDYDFIATTDHIYIVTYGIIYSATCDNAEKYAQYHINWMPRKSYEYPLSQNAYAIARIMRLNWPIDKTHGFNIVDDALVKKILRIMQNFSARDTYLRISLYLLSEIHRCYVTSKHNLIITNGQLAAACHCGEKAVQTTIELLYKHCILRQNWAGSNFTGVGSGYTIDEIYLQS